MKAEQLNNQYFELIDDCHEYYRKFLSQQIEVINIDETDDVYIDYMQNDGTYHEARIINLDNDCIAVYDMADEKNVHIDFESLDLSGKIMVLEMYEDYNFKQLS